MSGFLRHNNKNFIFLGMSNLSSYTNSTLRPVIIKCCSSSFFYSLKLMQCIMIIKVAATDMSILQEVSCFGV